MNDSEMERKKGWKKNVYKEKQKEMVEWKKKKERMNEWMHTYIAAGYRTVLHNVEKNSLFCKLMGLIFFIAVKWN